jgi:hydroxyacylglutathione hydrolase
MTYAFVRQKRFRRKAGLTFFEMEIQPITGRGFECNSYYIGGENPILIDVGTSQNVERIIDSLPRENGRFSISKIILTHTHIDHAGGASRLSELTGAEVLVHPSEGKRISEGDFSVTLAGLFGSSFEPFDWKGIEEGAVVDAGSGRLRVLHLPGHSEGSIGLWDEESRSLFVGDTVFADGGIGRFDLPSSDFDMLRSSIRRLSGLGVKDLYPGHGRAVIGTGSKHISESLRSVWSGV